jgi:TPR repeat protein
MTVILKPGYAPIEQYNSRGNQGPWTDVYALCATMYKMMTGKTPDDPFIRADDNRSSEKLYDSLRNSGVSNETSQILVKGLELLAASRYQNVGELEHDLYRVRESAEVSSASHEITKLDDRGAPESIPDKSADEETELIVKENVTERLSTYTSTDTQITAKKQQMHEQPVNSEDAATKSGTSNNKKAGKSNRRVLRFAIPIIAVVCLIIAGISWANSSYSFVSVEEAVENGNAYYYGKNHEKSYEEAAKWYEVAANAGDTDSMNKLASMYRTGRGVPIDYKKAAMWYRKAADAGDTNAMYHLSYIYRFGQGVPKDAEKANEWAQRAAENQ